MYLATSAAGDDRQQMGALVPVGINRVDVWVDTPLEAGLQGQVVTAAHRDSLGFQSFRFFV